MTTQGVKALLLFIVTITVTARLSADSLALVAERPLIDGKRDKFLQHLLPSKFEKIFTFDNQYSSKDVHAQYTFAMHKEGLYILIETDAKELSYHKRGFLYGDGFKLVIGKTNPFGRSKEYIELSYSPTELQEDKKREQYISSYNGLGSGKQLSSGASLAASRTENGTGFEAFIPWQDIHPYHPSFNREIGINLYFAKGMRDTQGKYVTKGFAIAPDEGIWDEAITSRKLKPYQIDRTPELRSSFSNSFYFDHHTVLSGQSLSIRFPLFDSLDAPKSFQVLSQDNIPVYTFSGTPNHERSIIFDTSPLKTGSFVLKTNNDPKVSRQLFTILPNVKPELLLEAIMEGDIDQGVRNTLQFNINAIQETILNLKPYEAAEHLHQLLLDIELHVKSALDGNTLFSNEQTVYRRAFRSMLDGSLQPYSIKLPKDYSLDKQYPLLVFLHGSGQDEQRLLEKPRGNGEFIELAPLGRDQINAYAYGHSKFDIEEAIADAAQHYSIDTSNIVIGGFSMGGYGALKIFSESPNRYKGLAIFAGHPNLANQWLDSSQFPDFSKPESLSVFRDVPIFIYHGTKDPALAFSMIHQFSRAVEKHGAELTTSFVKERGHVYQDKGTHLKYSNWLRRILKN